MADRYPVLAGEQRTETVEKGSRFIATVAPASGVDEAQAVIARISAEFPDATHNCWAYLVGAPGSTDRMGMSDAGEPHNTAGRPMLNVLLHADVGDVAAVVTRYFGGTKLGRGGLVRAYGAAVQAALDEAPRTTKVDWVERTVILSYPDAQLLERLLPTYEAEKTHEAFGAHVEIHLRVPREQHDELTRALEDATRGRATLEPPEEELG